MATTAELRELLADAEKQYHALLTGTAVVEFRDQNGELVRYTPANRAALSQYLDQLRQQIASSSGQTVSTGPMSIFM